MAKKLYVGNLSFSTTDERLQSVFSNYGNILSVRVVTDRDTGRSKGFGFVEFDDESDTDRAVSEMSGREVDGRKIRVNYAEERSNRR